MISGRGAWHVDRIKPSAYTGQIGYTAQGFTIIELMVVLAISAVLLTIVMPSYLGHVQRTKEAVLRENLKVLRVSLDQYYADRGHYPHELKALVTEHYLRAIPLDPITNSAESWIVVTRNGNRQREIVDIHSGAPGSGHHDPREYQQW